MQCWEFLFFLIKKKKETFCNSHFSPPHTVFADKQLLIYLSLFQCEVNLFILYFLLIQEHPLSLSVLLWHRAAIKMQIPYFLVVCKAARFCMGCGYLKMLATEYTVIFKNALCTQENKRSSTARKT